MKLNSIENRWYDVKQKQMPNCIWTLCCYVVCDVMILILLLLLSILFDRILLAVFVESIQIEGGTEIVFREEELLQFALCVCARATIHFHAILEAYHWRQLSAQRTVGHVMLLADTRETSHIDFTKSQIFQMVIVRDFRENWCKIDARRIPHGIECHQPCDSFVAFQFVVQSGFGAKVGDIFWALVCWLGKQQRRQYEYDGKSDAVAKITVRPQYQIGHFCVDERWRQIVDHCHAARFPCPNHYHNSEEEENLCFAAVQFAGVAVFVGKHVRAHIWCPFGHQIRYA